jgi:hypothetical protein
VIRNWLAGQQVQILASQPIEIRIAFVEAAKNLPSRAIHCINQYRELVFIDRDWLFNESAHVTL